MMIGLSCSSASRNLAFSDSVYFVPSLKTWPTSIACRRASLPLQRGQGSPSTALRRSANRSTSKSRCRLTPARCVSAAFAPVIALAMCWMSRSAKIGIFSFMPTGPAKPTGAPVTFSITSGGASSSFAAFAGAANLPLVRLVIAADQHGDRLAVGHVDQRLDQSCAACTSGTR